MLNNIKELQFKAPFYIFIGYLIFGLVILIIMIINLNDKNLGAFSILLASQVAGFAVLSTIINTNKNEEKNKEHEEIKAKNVLNSYFNHIIVLAYEQVNYFNDLEVRINNHPNSHLKDLKILETSYENELNIIAFVKPVESMLNPDLHKYSDPKMLDQILTIKAKVLEMMHHMKLINNIFVEHDQRTELLRLLNNMKNETNIIIRDSKKYTS